MTNLTIEQLKTLCHHLAAVQAIGTGAIPATHFTGVNMAHAWAKRQIVRIETGVSDTPVLDRLRDRHLPTKEQA